MLLYSSMTTARRGGTNKNKLKMEITQKQLDAAYQVATPEQKKVLDALFGKNKRTTVP